MADCRRFGARSTPQAWHPVIRSPYILGLLVYIVGFLIVPCTVSYAQVTHADSLYEAIMQSPDDTAKVDQLLDLCRQYFSSDPDKARDLAGQALGISEGLDYKSGIAYAFKNIGIVHYVLSEYADALSYWQQAKTVFEEIHDPVGVANMLSNMGAVYFNQGENNKALDLYLHALKLAEEADDTIRIATVLANIGAAHSHTRKSEQALESYLKALPLFEAIRDPDGIGLTCVNIGDLYHSREEYDLAATYHLRALQYLSSSTYLSSALLGLGEDYIKTGLYSEGMRYLDSALTKAVGNNFEAGKVLIALAHAKEEQGDLTHALSLYADAQTTVRKISNANVSLVEALEGLVRVHAKLRHYAKAFEYQQELTVVKDSLLNIESEQKFNRLLFNAQIEKKEGEITLLVMDKELQKVEVEKQKAIRNAFIAGFSVVLLFAVVFFMQRNKIKKGKRLSDALLLNILPAEVAEELKHNGKAEARDFDMATVLFTDFKEFTQTSERLSAQELVTELNTCFEAFDHICEKYDIEKIKTIGDAYMASGGLPVPTDHAVKNTVLAALEMQQFIAFRKTARTANHKPAFDMRVGMHTGPVVAGIVGVKKFQYDIWGDTVNTASRMESACEPGMVNVSQSTYQLLRDDPDLTFEHRGKVNAKGKGDVDMYFVMKKG